MANWEREAKRAEEVKKRAECPNSMYSYCGVIGCRQPARAGTSDGLDQRYCRAHADHYQRHGSALKGSYSASVLNPYRRAAMDWLLAHGGLFWVKDAVDRVGSLYRQAGRHVEAFRLRGLKPRERAWALWARLRHHAVDPRLPIAAWLAVEMAIADDLQPVSTAEFKRVQAAKIVHRMASGTHKRWDRERLNPIHPGLPPIIQVQRQSWYPKSRGRVLRHAGEDLEKAVAQLVAHHLEEVKDHKRELEARGIISERPYPKGMVARTRVKKD